MVIYKYTSLENSEGFIIQYVYVYNLKFILVCTRSIVVEISYSKGGCVVVITVRTVAEGKKERREEGKREGSEDIII